MSSETCAPNQSSGIGLALCNILQPHQIDSIWLIDKYKFLVTGLSPQIKYIWSPFYLQGLTLIAAWINCHMLSEM